MSSTQKEFYTAGELACLFEIPKQTLLYYDKTGLLVPEFISTNNYRYYSLKQYLILEIIINLRKLGIPVPVIKDYIKKPKENGYRSLHMIVLVDVYFSDHKDKVPIEIQFRTIAMNFWASTEHQLRYKKSRVFTEEMQQELKKCADIMADADDKMQNLANVSGIVQPIE